MELNEPGVRITVYQRFETEQMCGVFQHPPATPEASLQVLQHPIVHIERQRLRVVLEPVLIGRDAVQCME